MENAKQGAKDCDTASGTGGSLAGVTPSHSLEKKCPKGGPPLGTVASVFDACHTIEVALFFVRKVSFSLFDEYTLEAMGFSTRYEQFHSLPKNQLLEQVSRLPN